jgi:hypothetical protein
MNLTALLCNGKLVEIFSRQQLVPGFQQAHYKSLYRQCKVLEYDVL